MSLDGARVLVVGASAGIGRAFGVAAARGGADVVFAARRADRLDDAVQEAGSGYAVRIDVCDEATIGEAIDQAAARLGGIDAVLYAVGFARIARLQDQDAQQWQDVLGPNVVGAALTVRAAIPHLSPGAIVAFCSSTSDDQPRWGLSAYSVSKAALNRLVEGLRAEHRDTRFVRVTIGSTIGTEFGSNFTPELVQQAFAHWVVNAQHTANMMQPGDVANVLTDLIATMRANPNVDIPNLSIEPPGGPLTLPPTQDMVTKAYEALTPRVE
ncbi:MAG: short-chain dehydrogenase [Actinomycetia bacterium]|nr:short-chain dehydrogenase [Actinomycetes bacterium]